MTLSLLGLFPLTAAAEVGPYALGEKIEPFSLEDQHGAVQQVDASVAFVLYSRDMTGGDVLAESLEDAPRGILDERKAAYVVDISAMPKLVAKLFALPKMRKRPYSMLLDRDGETTQRLPVAEEKATVLVLEALEIVKVIHASEPDEVRAALGLPVSAE